MKTKFCIILMTLIFSQGALAQIIIKGATSCGTWVEEEAKHKAPGQYINTSRTWLVGYLSGLAVASDKNFWGRQGVNLLDNASAYLWIDNYCRANPLKSIDDGGIALFLERTRGM